MRKDELQSQQLLKSDVYLPQAYLSQETIIEAVGRYRNNHIDTACVRSRPTINKTALRVVNDCSLAFLDKW